MMEPTKSKKIELFLIDGTANGTIIALGEKCQFITAPRDTLPWSSEDETYQPYINKGVYIIKGEEKLYVGQSKNIHTRILQHRREKDWEWQRCCALTCNHDWFGAEEIDYLEERLIKLAQIDPDGRKLETDMRHTPASVHLKNKDKKFADEILQEALLVFPLLGFDFFYDSSNAAKDVSIPIFKIEQGKITASVRLQDDKWVVLKDSLGRLEFTPSWKTHSLGYYKQRERLKENGILQPQGDMLVFTQDTPFDSSSAAASVIYGIAQNGYKIWRVPEEGKRYSQWQTYGEWEDSRPES